MIYERIKELCKKNGISVNELEKRIGVAKGYLCKVDKHKPSLEKARLISEELHTSVDFLMTGKDSGIIIEMADMDTELIFMEKRLKEYALRMAKLSKEDQNAIMQMIDRFSK